MGDAWKDRKKAKEEEYFEQQQKQLFARLKQKKERAPLNSPVCGKPMSVEEHLGVSIERCPESGGVWLDKGELEKLLQQAPEEERSNQSVFSRFFFGLTGKVS